MTMKKRFLGLALAAMVAVPATTAYADTAILSGLDTKPLTQEVTVSGSVSKADGTAAEGRIEVELPTTLSFAVDQKGRVESANYSVTNKSSKAVIVSVQSFTDTTPNEGDGITVKSSTELATPANEKRSTVALSLVGTPVPGNSGTTTVDLSNINQSTGDDILGINPNTKATMTLSGIAGTMADEQGIDKNGASDQFNLVFKIRAADLNA